MELESDNEVFPYHMSYRLADLRACLGTYSLFATRFQGFERELNDDYCLRRSEKYAKLADREWVEW